MQRRWFLVVLVVCTIARTAFAHDPGLSSANIDVRANELRATLTFNARDLSAFDGQPLAELAARAADIEIDGRRIAPRGSEGTRDANNNVELSARFNWPTGSHQQLSFRSTLLKQLSFGHREALAFRDGDGAEIARRMLSANDDSAIVSLTEIAQATNANRFVDFLLLGIRHILTGYDHLLFLAALLIMCRTGRSAALLITCFTGAHSLTLALSTFDLVHLQSRIVESAIAASILYVGIENFVRGERHIRARWLLTFFFGLVHGLGFASVLREMGVANTGAGAVVPLVAFNLGVEVGQLSVAAIVLPIVWQLRRHAWFVRNGVRACSGCIALIGSYWFVMRSCF